MDQPGSDAAAALAKACEHALVAGARGAATRQQVRAAARRFVRRNRRDAGYLSWVLCSVSTCSGLAVALLGLSAAPASAKLAPFSSVSIGIGTTDLGQNLTPSLGDLDGDGDLDAVAGEVYGTFLYFRNVGDADFFALSPASNPLSGQDVGFFSTPALGDLDGDGDLDLLAGERYGTFLYYENTGSATNPLFIQRFGSANPLNDNNVGGYSNPALGDLDGDGDLDLVAGGSDLFFYYENTGTATNPVFVPRTGAANPLNGQVIGGGTPALGDLDGDGDLDLVAGENFGGFFVFENTGDATSAAFVARTGAANPLAGADIGSTSAPALGDIDADGDPDLVSGEFDGFVNAFVNRAGGFALRTGSANPLAGEDVGFNATPALGDLDGDGDLDLVAGSNYGILSYFENIGTTTSPDFFRWVGPGNPLDGQDVGGYSTPALGDLDGDGDLDVIAGEDDGGINYFENIGTTTSPDFFRWVGPGNPLDGQDVGGYSTPALGDLDGDGDLDVLAGEPDGSINYFENTGTAASPAFVPRTGAANPLNFLNVGLDSATSLGDLDGDGDLDLLSIVFLYENTGSAAAPGFVRRSQSQILVIGAPSLGDLDADGDLDLVAGTNIGTFSYGESFVEQDPLSTLELTGPANPLAGSDVGSLAGPVLADLDADGDRDLVAGEDLGTFRFFANTGSVLHPAFAARTGAANPLNDPDVGDEAKPALGDLDGDGDFDLLAGRLAGDFLYFQNTGDATGPLFAAPIANPFGLAGVESDSSAPTLGDLDADGDLDLVVGQYFGGFAYYENTGNRTSPAFVLRTGPLNPLADFDPSYYASPALGDFDSDGDLDLASGREHGRLFFFQNQGPVTSPAFGRLIGPANPLDGEDVGDRSAPAAADLDGDGDDDLVTGALSGTFAVHYFPEPARGLLLGAGIALLERLARLRRRSR